MPPSVIFALVAAAGVFLLATGIHHRRPRRIRTGALLALMSLPAWLMSRDDFIPRSRAILFVAPQSSEAALVKSIEALPPNTLVSILRLAELSGLPSSNPLKAIWRPRRLINSANALNGAQTLPADAGWIDRAANASRQSPLAWALHLCPRPTIIVIHEPSARVWATMPPRSIVITNAVAALGSQGSELFVLDAALTATSGGHLEIELSSQKTLETFPMVGSKPTDLNIEATLRLVNSSERSASGMYRVRAWIDRSVDAARTNIQFEEFRPAKLSGRADEVVLHVRV